MKSFLSKTAVYMTVAALTVVVTSRGDGHPRELRRNVVLPSRMLWAWERKEDLRFLPQGIGVAYLERTIKIGVSGVEEYPRMQSLRVTDGTPLIAVVRIEHGGGPTSDEVRKQIVRAVVEAGSRKGVIGVQTDFDAKVSEREFYRELLKQVRSELPKEKVLSMTALVSWCTNDDWIAGMPVDEAVPMYFRMGTHTGDARWWAEREVNEPLCRGVLGRANDEPLESRSALREYWFSTTPWNETTYRAMEIAK